MTQTQRRIGVGGVIAVIAILLYPPWRLEYERGYSRIAYAPLFSPPTDYGVVIGNENLRSPQSQSVAAWMLLGEVAAVVALVGFLLWLYRPAGSASDAAVPTLARE